MEANSHTSSRGSPLVQAPLSGSRGSTPNLMKNPVILSESSQQQLGNSSRTKTPSPSSSTTTLPAVGNNAPASTPADPSVPFTSETSGTIKLPQSIHSSSGNGSSSGSSHGGSSNTSSHGGTNTMDQNNNSNTNDDDFLVHNSNDDESDMFTSIRHGHEKISGFAGGKAKKSLKQKGVVSAPPDELALDADERAVAEFLAILEEHRHDCEQNSMYIEAEIAKKRLEELRAHEDKRRREALKSRHLAERLDVEEAHMLEFEAFNQAWNKKMDLYDTRTQVLLQEMKERHQEELAEWQNQMQSRFLLRPKLSKEVLNLRKIEQNLAKAKNYMEAHKVKLRADAKEKWELEDLKKDWKQKVEAQQAKFIIQQQQELDAFKQRIEAGRLKQQRVRQNELERTMQRYDNIKQDLDRQQRMEANRTAHIESSGVAMAPHLRKGGVKVPGKTSKEDVVNDTYGTTEFNNVMNKTSTKFNAQHKTHSIPIAAMAYSVDSLPTGPPTMENPKLVNNTPLRERIFLRANEKIEKGGKKLSVKELTGM